MWRGSQICLSWINKRNTLSKWLSTGSRYPKKRRARIFESVQLALRLGNGLAAMLVDNELHIYSQQNACPTCGLSIGELEPRSFSFNSPFGACKECNGLGFKLKFNPDLIIPDKSKSILEGAIKPWLGRFASFRLSKLRDVGKHFGFNLNVPISKFTERSDLE